MNAIELKQVNFSYDGKTKILENTDFTAEYGEVTLLSGHSGEGKSTLMYIVSGIIPNVNYGELTGEVLVGGESIKGRKMGDICRKVGVVLQNADEQIIQKIVEDEIAFGCENLAFPPEKIQKQIDIVCNLLKLDKSWKCRTLSGGQKQRLITASTLAMGQKICSCVRICEYGAEEATVLLKLENIGKIYDSNDILTVGIRGIDLAFDYNEFVTIEGESGSGKSTLLNVIGANDTYEEGELYFNGEPTSHYSEADWEKYREKNIATIFQDFNIIENLTVLENVELALLRLDDVKERKKRAKELIARVGLTEQMNRRGSKLSGGEKQRTVIARALAKDAPVILADEPTGNLDVKASKEVAALLKEVSKDKLVIVVTHNPEFFKQYATRRVRIYDGSVSEDKQIEQPAPLSQTGCEVLPPVNRFHNFRNTLHIGVLNYKSRPKFTTMMSLALAVCAVTLFLVIALFGQSLISPLTTTLDGVGIEGKVIVSGTGDGISAETLDELAYDTNAGYILGDRTLSEFTVTVPESGDMLGDYEVVCLYSPYEYNLSANEGVLVLPQSASSDGAAIAGAFTNAGVGLENIEIKTSLTAEDVRLYLGYGALAENGLKIQAINSTVRLGEDETTVYTFAVNENLADGNINLVNSNYFNVVGRTAVFTAKADKAYIVADASGGNESIDGLIVEMSEADYAAMFESGFSSATLACLYFPSDDAARAAVSKLPEGYMGLLSTSGIYVQSAGDVFTSNVLWYVALIAASLLVGVLIGIIFMRSVKIYQADFAVYRTLGIPNKVSSRSLYIQMALIFLPTLVLLPLVSLVAAVIPGSNLAFISAGNYFFIEVMLLLIVELVAFGFNKSLNGQSIRKSLRRGSK